MWHPGFVRTSTVLVQRVLAGLAVLHGQMNLFLIEYELVIFLNSLSRCAENHSHSEASHQTGNQKHRLGEFSLDIHFLFSLWSGHLVGVGRPVVNAVRISFKCRYARFRDARHCAPKPNSGPDAKACNNRIFHPANGSSADTAGPWKSTSDLNLLWTHSGDRS